VGMIGEQQQKQSSKRVSYLYLMNKINIW